MRLPAAVATAAAAFVAVVAVVAPARASLDAAVVTRTEASLVLLTCPAAFATATTRYATALVIASRPQRSYLVAPIPTKCDRSAARVAYPGGDLTHPYAVREIALDSQRCQSFRGERPTMCGFEQIDTNVEIVAIDAGPFPAAQLAPDGDVAGDAFILSFTQPVVPAPAGRVRARLNETSVSSGQPRYATRAIAARGISAAGVVVRSSGEVVGVVATEMDSVAMLLGDEHPSATVDYLLSTAAAIRSVARFSAEPIDG